MFCLFLHFKVCTIKSHGNNATVVPSHLSCFSHPQFHIYMLVFDNPTMLQLSKAW